jgi:hypothetical protein
MNNTGTQAQEDRMTATASRATYRAARATNAPTFLYHGFGGQPTEAGVLIARVENDRSARRITFYGEDGAYVVRFGSAAKFWSAPCDRTCAWCGTTAATATMERINAGPSVACKDTRACQARMDSL